MAAFQEPAHHVRPHSAKTDDSELHEHTLLRAIAAVARAAIRRIGDPGFWNNRDRCLRLLRSAVRHGWAPARKAAEDGGPCLSESGHAAEPKRAAGAEAERSWLLSGTVASE